MEHSDLERGGVDHHPAGLHTPSMATLHMHRQPVDRVCVGFPGGGGGREAPGRHGIRNSGGALGKRDRHEGSENGDSAGGEGVP